MALAVFNQFPQLTRFFAQLARVAAHKETAKCAEERTSEGKSAEGDRDDAQTTARFVRLDLSTGRVTLIDHVANLAALDGGVAAAFCAIPITWVLIAVVGALADSAS